MHEILLQEWLKIKLSYLSTWCFSVLYYIHLIKCPRAFYIHRVMFTPYELVSSSTGESALWELTGEQIKIMRYKKKVSLRTRRISGGHVSHHSSEASSTLQWRHNGRDSVSNHQPHDCLHKRWPVKSPHKWLVTRKIFPFDDAIIAISLDTMLCTKHPAWCLKYHSFGIWKDCFMVT